MMSLREESGITNQARNKDFYATNAHSSLSKKMDSKE
jgi:hypothetical protein